MIVAGIDIGSTTGKAVVMIDDKIIFGNIITVTTKPSITASMAIDEAIKNAGLSGIKDIEYFISTGYGRLKVDVANENISEISCHAKGDFHLMPSVRTIIDIGGQDCKAISLNAKGAILEFQMNERCAAGTGRFFQVMAKILACGLEGIGASVNISETPASISNQCSVFAESPTFIEFAPFIDYTNCKDTLATSPLHRPVNTVCPNDRDDTVRVR